MNLIFCLDFIQVLKILFKTKKILLNELKSEIRHIWLCNGNILGYGSSSTYHEKK